MADMNTDILIEYEKLKKLQLKQREATKRWTIKHPEKIIEYRNKINTPEYYEHCKEKYYNKYKEKYHSDPNTRLKQSESNKRYYEKKKTEKATTA
jgi:hypothetical protein